MNLIARSLLLVGLALVISQASNAENKQEEGEKLIRQADDISNLRSADARPFRLTATFRLLGDGAATGEGTYTEIWGSPGRWRRESVLGTFHRTEVGDEKTRWFLDSSEEVPGKAGQLGSLMHIWEHQYPTIKVAAIRDENVRGVQARCIEVRGSLGKETLCVDVRSGVLLQRKIPTLWVGKKSEYSCDYGEYEQFADRMYPHHIRCTEGIHQGIDVRVLELTNVPSLESSLFDRPIGAKELANCSGNMQAPNVLQAPDPRYPAGQDQPTSPEVLWMIVGRDGKPRDLRVVRSIGTAFDKPALEAVSLWIFKPATCDGESVPVQTNVEVVFRKW
jgi:Gram-negative bacterial TonB protein C-terminal